MEGGGDSTMLLTRAEISTVYAGGVDAVAGEWLLVCLAFNLKRFHTLSSVY